MGRVRPLGIFFDFQVPNINKLYSVFQLIRYRSQLRRKCFKSPLGGEIMNSKFEKCQNIDEVCPEAFETVWADVEFKTENEKIYDLKAGSLFLDLKNYKKC
jgi:hypothetical protein